MVVAEQTNGERYYDHKLSRIEKGKLLNLVDQAVKKASPTELSSTLGSGVANQNRPTDGGETLSTPVSVFKDKFLFPLLQTNSSKVVDENGEPRVVYHGSASDNITVFDWNNMNGALANRGAYYFSPYPCVGEAYAGKGATSKVYDVFLNARNIKEVEYYIDISTINVEKVKELKSEGYDGVSFVPTEKDIESGYLSKDNEEYVVFEPNQIKSATDNDGDFDPDNDNIRFRDDEDGCDEGGSPKKPRKRNETEDVWLDRSLGIKERISAAAACLSQNQAEDKTLRNDALSAISSNLSDLRKAMSLQNRFDQTTVKRVGDLACVLITSLWAGLPVRCARA